MIIHVQEVLLTLADSPKGNQFCLINIFCAHWTNVQYAFFWFVVDGSDLLSHNELERSVEAGFSYADKLARIEDDLISKGIFVDASSPFHRMAKFKKPNPEAMVTHSHSLLPVIDVNLMRFIIFITKKMFLIILNFQELSAKGQFLLEMTRSLQSK